MGWRPYEGMAEVMFGPRLYGYVNVSCFCYGEKGGQYLLSTAIVSSSSHTEDGQPRLPVWSDEKDDIVVACPRSLAVEVIEESQRELNYIWVHQVSRDPDDWRHDGHPRGWMSLRVYDETTRRHFQWTLSTKALREVLRQCQEKGIDPRRLARSQIRRHDNDDIGRIEIR